MNTLLGRVLSIKTESNGKAVVTIDSTAFGGIPPANKPGPLDNFFYYPDNMSEAILSEFKRAQDASLPVKIEFDDQRSIASVTVL